MVIIILFPMMAISHCACNSVWKPQNKQQHAGFPHVTMLMIYRFRKIKILYFRIFYCLSSGCILNGLIFYYYLYSHPSSYMVPTTQSYRKLVTASLNLSIRSLVETNPFKTGTSERSYQIDNLQDMS